MNLFTISIPDDADALLVTYEAGALIRVQSSPTSGGSYGDVVTIPIVSGQSVYPVYDADGIGGTWYKYRYEAADNDPLGDYSAAFQPVQSDDLYASLASFKDFVRDSDANITDDTTMLLALASASRAIDRTCNRRFALATGTQTARHFTPDRLPATEVSWGRYVVRIDDTFDATSTLALDSTGNGDYDVASTTFRMAPLDAPAKGKPYTMLLMDYGTSAWSRGEFGAAVTSDWGWTAVPDTISYATMLQAHRFLKRRDSPFGVAGSPDLGNELRLLAQVDADVAVMVAAYRRNWGAV